MDWKLVAIYLANLLCCLIYDIIAPFYPIEAQSKGQSNLHIGMVFTLMPLTTFVTSPIVGCALKLVGRRVTFTAGNVLMVTDMQGVSMCLMGVADLYPSTVFLVISCISRAAAGVAAACINTVCTV